MIHETACVDLGASIGRNVTIGPHCCIGPHVVLGDECVLHNNVTIVGHTTCDAGNEFFAGTAVGVPPQDLKYRGGKTRVEIGKNNIFRENVTVHAGTEVAEGVTQIGSHNRFFVGVHLAHDVKVGDDCILSNYVQLAGHVSLEDKVTMGGLIGVHHFTTIGMLSYIGGLTRIVSDVPPYMIVEGNPSRVRGFNETGMRRWGMNEVQVRSIRDAYRMLFGPRSDEFGASLLERVTRLEARPNANGEVTRLCASIRRSLDRGIYGRQLESDRRDTEEDRESFYSSNKDGETRP